MAVRVIEALFSCILAILYFKIINVITGIVIKKSTYWYSVFLLWLISIVITISTNQFTLLRIPLIFISYLIVSNIIFYKALFSILFFCTLVQFIPSILVDNIIYYIVTGLNLSVNKTNVIIFKLLSNLSLVGIIYLALRIARYLINKYGGVKRAENLTSWNKYLFITYILLASNIYMISMYQIDKAQIEKYIWLIPLTFLIVVSFSAYSQYLVKAKEYKNSQLHYYLNTMSKLSNDIKQFKHDFNNVLISLYGLAEKEEWQDLKERLQELQGSKITQYSSEIEAMVNIREPSLISLLAAKMFYANNHKISFFIEAPHIINKMPIKGTDFIRIVGILLDNAIEAAKQCSEPEVGAIFLSYNDYFELIITNSISNNNLEVAAIDKDGYSTKGIGRGTGLSSLASMLENYMPVEWNTVVKNNKFMQCIGFKRK
ncbi:GHKL domain-containing protein [Clostridium sp. 'deep sea']|uniref:sensor histidine kinase n=1 Tax=Clostridium sp. 'deep sea' TaxID=2779445 RepID=UPI0018964344|nr:GHKL domain-containing protein [Clostridium sp. 'deep sea']QOR33868.1 GHKL domain-containing protein [Clostridium sp. 'deep sea']